MFGIGMWELVILAVFAVAGLVGLITLVVVAASTNKPGH
jgi:hypothetical protein